MNFTWEVLQVAKDRTTALTVIDKVISSNQSQALRLAQNKYPELMIPTNGHPNGRLRIKFRG